jgi:hypothetical protein
MENNNLTHNTDSNEISKPIPQSNNGENSKEDCRMEEIANVLRESNRTDAKNLKGSDLEDFQKEFIFEYANENNLWIKDLYSLGVATGIGGNENCLAYNIEESVVYKSNNLYNVKFLISNFFEKLIIHNLIFPNTKYTFVGFTGHKMGKTPYVEPIAKQDFIQDATQATVEEIKAYMVSLGFSNTFEDVYRYDGLVVHDLKPRNVLKDKYGDIYVIDAEFIQDAELPIFQIII